MFQELGLSAPLVASLAEQDILTPTPIQTRAIPLIREGGDILGIAKTGSGKTLAYTLPMLENLSREEACTHPRALIIVPVRDLADQVGSVIRSHERSLGLKSCVVVGGDKLDPQIEVLRSGIDVVVGTPGRLLDLFKKGELKLDRIKILVLDELDRVLEEGMGEDVLRLVAAMPVARQTLMVSATLPAAVRSLARQIQKDPHLVRIDDGLPAEIKHAVVSCQYGARFPAIVQVLRRENPESCFVFVRTQEETEHLAVRLKAFGINAVAFSGALNLNQRRGRLQRLRDGEALVVVATDALSRGIDIADLDLVVNYGIPQTSDDYIHRSGRTGRAGKEGRVISIVSPPDAFHMRTSLRRHGVELDNLSVDAGIPQALSVSPSVPSFERVTVPETIVTLFDGYDRGLAQLFDPELRPNLSLKIQPYPILAWVEEPTEKTALESMYAGVVVAAEEEVKLASIVWLDSLRKHERILPWMHCVAHFAAHMLIRKLYSEGVADRNVMLSAVQESPYREFWFRAIEAGDKPLPAEIRGGTKGHERVSEEQVRGLVGPLFVKAEQEQIPLLLSYRGDIHTVIVKCRLGQPQDSSAFRDMCRDLAEQSGWTFDFQPTIIENRWHCGKALLDYVDYHLDTGKFPHIAGLRLVREGFSAGLIEVLLVMDSLQQPDNDLRERLVAIKPEIVFALGKGESALFAPPVGTSYIRFKPHKNYESGA